MPSKMYLGLLASVLVLPALGQSNSTGLDAYLEAEEPIAIAGVLANIGSSGSKVEGAADGIVVASPSKSDPDYFYTWTRDASLTFKAIIERFIDTGDAELETLIRSFITGQAALQGVENPSGGLATGGLAEPKFHVDMSAFTEAWGRPQRDGPALRATAGVAYARYLLEKGDTANVKDIIWPVVNNDLSYVSEYWSQQGFDLWEEVQGISFFTLISQHRALVEGSALAAEIGLDCPNCDSQAPQIRCKIQSLWQDEGFMLSDVANNGRTGKGTNTVIASIHSFDPAAGCDDATFQPCSSKALSNLKLVVDSFRTYEINSGIPEGEAVALGRYIEDVYMGGHPWYLTTTAAAEQLYYAVATWTKVGSITIDDVSLAFFKDVYADAAAGDYAADSEEFTAITTAVTALADGFLAVVMEYTPEDGSLAEQFGKSDGKPLSAKDLTWSYAALLTAKAARDGKLPASWGADKATDVPTACEDSSATGAYATATNTAWA
ncbi:related to glucoamylase precursor [Cephalotrichum gorgonifer]|uniref:glucan 1,4-alpha-glucosidase n=1 Tax=Cephalotrichum gorgonifer TaxID=2041049 RepID=A0AAE8N4J7_9PEZI|nr:related to glucoamylase precursor [Cephalotrichum gorgonifer]